MRNFMRVLFFLSDISPRCRLTVAYVGKGTFPLPGPGNILSFRDYFPLLQTFAERSALWKKMRYFHTFQNFEFTEIFNIWKMHEKIP